MKANNMNGIDSSETETVFTPPTYYLAVATTDDTTTSHATTSTNTNTIHYGGTDGPVEAEELMLYRSKCHIDDIPNVARGMTWNDPFYEGNNDPGECAPDIIAAFDIDRTLFDQPTSEICKNFILIPILSLCTLPIFIVFGLAEVFMWLYFIYCFIVLIMYVLVDSRRSEAKARISRMHIAISPRGIYIDEADAPGSFSIACRTTIKYDEIKKCQVKSEYNYFHHKMLYTLTINTADDRELKTESGTSLGFVPKYTFVGIRNQQKFVDIVNAMMEHQKVLRAPVLNSVVVEPTVVYEVDGLI